jgi:hypothetical protein
LTGPRFAVVSEALTGWSGLDRVLAAEYLTRIRATGPASDLPRLLQAYDASRSSRSDPDRAFADAVFGDEALRALCIEIILLWYLGEVHEPNKPVVGGHPEHYYRGLLWPTIRAHPPALSGGYFGHWAYPPDN